MICKCDNNKRVFRFHMACSMSHAAIKEQHLCEQVQCLKHGRRNFGYRVSVRQTMLNKQIGVVYLPKFESRCASILTKRKAIPLDTQKLGPSFTKTKTILSGISSFTLYYINL